SDASRSNTTTVPRTPSALTTKSASMGAGKASSSATGTTKKAASTSAGNATSSA
ncbi:unnamed protein product, partial [Rotaria socialis]